MSSASRDAPLEREATEVQCSLNVFSHSVSAREVTAHVGIEPTVERVKGEARPGRNREMVVASHQWVWKPASSVEHLLDPQLDAIWSVLGPYAQAFSSLPAEAKVTLSMWIVHHGTELSLGWVLDRRHVAAAAAFGASLDVDEYDDTE
jgi:hypothetical protein